MSNTSAVLSQMSPPTGVSTAAQFSLDGQEYLAVVRVSVLHIYKVKDDRIQFIISQSFAERILQVFPRIFIDELSGMEKLQLLLCFDSHKAVLYALTGLRLSQLMIYDFTVTAEEALAHEQASYALYDNSILVCICGTIRTYIGLAQLDTGSIILIPFVGEKIIDVQCLSRSSTNGPQLGILTSFPVPAQRWARNARAAHLHVYTIEYNGAGLSSEKSSQRDAFTLALQHKVSNLPSDSYSLTALEDPLNLFLVHSTRVFVLVNPTERTFQPLHFRFSFLPEEQTCSSAYIKSAISQCASLPGSHLSPFVEKFTASSDLKLVSNKLLSLHNGILTTEKTQFNSVHRATLPIAPTLMPAHPIKGGLEYPYYGFSIDRPDEPVCLSQISNVLGGFPALDLHLYMEACGSTHIDNLLRFENRTRSSITPGEYINMSAFGKYPSNLEYLGPRSDVFNYLQIPPLNGTRVCYLKSSTTMLKGWHNILVMDSRGLSFIMRFHSDNGAITKQSLELYPVCLCDRNAAITTGSPAMLFPPSVILALSAASTKNTPLGYELERRYRAVAELPADVRPREDKVQCDVQHPYHDLFSVRVFVGSLVEDSLLCMITMSTATPKQGYYYDYRPCPLPGETNHANITKLAQALYASSSITENAAPHLSSLSSPLVTSESSAETRKIQIFGQSFNVESYHRIRIFANAKLLKPFSGSILRLIERQTTHLPTYDTVMHGLVFPYAILPSMSSVKDASAKPVGLGEQKDANARPRLHLLHEAGAISMVSSYATSTTSSQFKYAQKMNRLDDRATSLSDSYVCAFYHMNPDANNHRSLRSMFSGAISFNILVTSRDGTNVMSITKDTDLFSSTSTKKELSIHPVSTPAVLHQPTILAFTLACGVSVQVCPLEMVLFAYDGLEKVSVSIGELASSCKPQMLQDCSEHLAILHAESDYVRFLFLTTSTAIFCVPLPTSKADLVGYRTSVSETALCIYTMTSIENFCSSAFLSAKNSEPLLAYLSLSRVEVLAADYLSSEEASRVSKDVFMKRIHTLVLTINDDHTSLGCLFAVTSNARIIFILLLEHKTTQSLLYLPLWVWQVYEQNLLEKDHKSKISFRTNTHILSLLPYICNYGVFEYCTSTESTKDITGNILMGRQVSPQPCQSSDMLLPYNTAYMTALFETQRDTIASEMTPDRSLAKHANHLSTEINTRRISSIYVSSTPIISQVCTPVPSQFGSTEENMKSTEISTNITLFIAYFGGHTSVHRIGPQLDAQHKLCATLGDSIALTTQPISTKSVATRSIDSSCNYEYSDLWSDVVSLSFPTKEKVVTKSVALRIGRPFRPIYLVDAGPQQESLSLPLIFIGTPRPTTGATPVSCIAVPNLFGSYSLHILGRTQSYLLLNKRYSIPIQHPVRQMLPICYIPGCSFPACLNLIDSSLPISMMTQGTSPHVMSNFTNIPHVYLHRNGIELGSIENIYFGTHLLYKDVCEKEYKDTAKGCCFLNRRLTHSRKNIIYNLLYLASFGNNTQMPVRTILNLPPGLKGSKMCYNVESDAFAVVSHIERYEVRNPRSIAKDEVAGIKVSEEIKALRDYHRIGDMTEEDALLSAQKDGDQAQLEAYTRFKEEGLVRAKEIMLASPPTYNSFMKVKFEALLLIVNDPSMSKYRVCDYYLYDLKRYETSTTLVSDTIDSQFPRRFGSAWRHEGGISRDDFGCINRRNYHNSQTSEQTSSKPREILRSGAKELILLGTGYLLGPDEKCYGTCKILALEKTDKNDDIKANKWNLGAWSSFFAFRLITQEEFQNVITTVRSFPAARVILIGENKRICAYHLEDSCRLTCCSVFERCGYISNISRFNEFISVSDLMLRNGLYVFRSRGSRNNPISYSSNDLPIYASDFLVSGVTKEMNVIGVSLHRIVCLLSYPYTKTSQRLVSQLAVQSSCKIPWTCVSILQAAGWINAPEVESNDRPTKSSQLTSNANCILACAEGAVLVAIPVPAEVDQFIEMMGCFNLFDIGPHCIARKRRSFDRRLVYDSARLIILQTLDNTSRDYSGLGPKAANIRGFNNLIWRLMSDAVCL